MARSAVRWLQNCMDVEISERARVIRFGEGQRAKSIRAEPDAIARFQVPNAIPADQLLDPRQTQDGL